MKKIKSCLIISLLFYLQILYKFLFCNGFYVGHKINFLINKRTTKYTYKKKFNGNKFFKKSSYNENTVDKLSSLDDSTTTNNEEHIKPDIKKNYDKLKENIEKQKVQIDEILKKSKSIHLERSFSFNKDDIMIKPELLKDLITQKYRKLFQRHDKDCGSSEIQIIILTFKIYFLTEHMKKNKKDFACLRGLFKCVSKRRKLLIYLGMKNREIFDKITDFFKIKKPLLPRTPEYYSKDLKYIHFKNTKRFKNNAEKKKKDKLKKKKEQTDKILFSI
ncbi:apicoplast ribosomal protein S15 precursor, putative [Plasmodium gallinaceum]|uniref:Apicoplast ribosomal protein S15, putative n=1 Tax=Plasmodium gallinaceum TaxID=5849 RepID=A0A1J1GUC9_PLAGA|nr:apicoplast ribosomal protein S15 precursor, putative [Plasmodium gallinaceum]CRG96119.1 apicoplast ribosomal protein S15 precursor, putative [Plasmodium gallinaceum]